MLQRLRHAGRMRGIVLLFAILLAGLSTVSPLRAKDEAKPVSAAGQRGTRFEIAASVKADPASQYVKQVYDGSRASLTVKIRISAHAAEADFFGEVSERFEGFALNEGAPERRIWREDKCHQKRGLPKMTVTAIDGTITTQKGPMQVEARPRILGLRLPQDEISQETRLSSGAADPNLAMTYRLKTRLSHLLVDIRLFAFDCNLPAGGTSTPPSRNAPSTR